MVPYLHPPNGEMALHLLCRPGNRGAGYCSETLAGVGLSAASAQAWTWIAVLVLYSTRAVSTIYLKTGSRYVGSRFVVQLQKSVFCFK